MHFFACRTSCAHKQKMYELHFIGSFCKYIRESVHLCCVDTITTTTAWSDTRQSARLHARVCTARRWYVFRPTLSTLVNLLVAYIDFARTRRQQTPASERIASTDIRRTNAIAITERHRPILAPSNHATVDANGGC